ncbi:MAG: ABC transporter substrate-binding protein [Chloroflexota bacterium]|jgi:alpha-1,4-digalacturonate transport system substrate-binding protein|nr:ABC transporter substrate-binding protein [Anaerolineae bacterium]
MKFRTALMLVLIAVLALPLAPSAAQEPVELRITWYDDGNEGAVLRDLLDRFEADNPDIKVVIDTVPYSAILENLPLQLEAGEGPDIARVTDLGGLSEYYLDLRPYLSDPAYWEDNFGPYLTWLRQPGDEEGIYGFQTQLTVTGMYINRTLFEQAGVEVPSDANEQVSWEEWGQTCKSVADAIGPDVFGFAMDRSGHRFAGPAISMGAQYFDENGHPTVTDEGYRAMAELFVQWHQDGTALVDVWAATPGYVGANEDYANGRLVCYMSGSWQVQQFSNTIGDAFDWEVVPFPCGPAGCTGVPGGAAVVAIKDTEHPEEVARVMEYLVQEDVLREFHARTLFIPAHAGVAAGGVPFETDLDLARAALEQWSAMVPDIMPLAVRIQGYPYNRIVFDSSRDRIAQVIVGELTLDEAIQRTQEDIDNGLAELEG